ncbi:MAG TPA: hypothetical protein VHN80_04320 [Kineosporiaceae bacterium]|jgi:hypothetical protein|nr:hypothetical protein [Kineosporiaceae bacterium]
MGRVARVGASIGLARTLAGGGRLDLAFFEVGGGERPEHHLVLQRLHVPARLAGCFGQLGGPVTVDRARSAAAAVGVVEHHRLVPVPDAHVLGQRPSSVDSLRRGGRVGVVDGAQQQLHRLLGQGVNLQPERLLVGRNGREPEVDVHAVALNDGHQAKPGCFLDRPRSATRGSNRPPGHDAGDPSDRPLRRRDQASDV